MQPQPLSPVDSLPLHHYRTRFVLDVSSSKTGVSTVKRPFQPSKIVRARRHGFRARMATVAGRNIINKRRAQGRKKLSA